MAENKCDGCCIYESTIEELRRDADRNSEQHREFYGKFTAQSTAIAISEERYNNLLNVISEVKASLVNINKAVEELKAKPTKKWENITTYVLTAIVGGVIAYLFTQLGLK